MRGTTFTLQIPISVAPAGEARKQPARLPSAAEPHQAVAADSSSPSSIAAPTISSEAATIGPSGSMTSRELTKGAD
jgi:hypothetical protein